jgi:hypothetical protein
MNCYDELLRRLRQRPFEPFRIHLTDGRTLDVRYPDLNLVVPSYALIGVPEPNVPDPFADHWIPVEWEHIRQIESCPTPPLPAAP